jgi:REP-associated tyrosine transposase
MTPYDPRLQHRKSIRLKGYDYRSAGAYFITLCAFQRECLFGVIKQSEMCLNPNGEIVRSCWEQLPHYFPLVSLVAFCVMPNHLHGVIVLADNRLGEASASLESILFGKSTADASPLRGRPMGTMPGSLGAILQNFKSVTTRRINQTRGITGKPVWQRSYYEHVIRSQAEMNRISEYILANPARWSEDEENPFRG